MVFALGMLAVAAVGAVAGGGLLTVARNDRSEVGTGAAQAFGSGYPTDAVVLVTAGGYEGSGFAVGDGLLLTNDHVVHGIDRVRVHTSREEERDCVVALADAVLDLAALRCSGSGWSTLRLADRPPVTGDPVSAVGYPGGRGPVTIQGTVMYGALITPDAHSQELLTLPIRPGSSGSPVIDANGRVVGVASAGDGRGHALAVGLEPLRDFTRRARRLFRPRRHSDPG